jgi:hypothetical protein
MIEELAQAARKRAMWIAIFRRLTIAVLFATVTVAAVHVVVAFVRRTPWQ